MRWLIGWLFILAGTILMGIGQNISTEAYDEWTELMADEMLK